MKFQTEITQFLLFWVHGLEAMVAGIFAAIGGEDGRFLGEFSAENFQLTLMDKITFFFCKIHP